MLSVFDDNYEYELRNIRVSLENGSIILEGTVSSFYLKQQAQEVARKKFGNNTLKIENRTIVQSRNYS